MTQNMTQKKILSLLMAFSLSVSLSSCAAEQNQGEISKPVYEAPNKNVHSEEDVKNEERTFSALQSSDGFSWGGFGEEGLYYVNAAGRSDGSCNLCYVDYQSAQSMCLCSQPNCTHDNESCSSYLIPTPGGIVTERVAERIILFFQNSPFYDPDNTSKARVESIALNGSDRKVIHEFSPNEIPQKPMLTDGKSVFFVLWSVETEEKESANLVSLDIYSGELSIVKNMDTSINERIWGTDGQDFVIYRYTAPMSEENWQYELISWNPATGNEKQLYNWSSGEDRPILQGDTLVIKGEDGFYHLLKLDTLEDIALTHYPLPEKDSGVSLSIMAADQSHLIIRESRLSDNGKAVDTYYMLDSEGQKEDWNLLFDVDGDVQPYTIVTDISDDSYLVYIGENEISEISVSVDGTTNRLIASRKNYAVMKAADYWNGENILTKIE